MSILNIQIRNWFWYSRSKNSNLDLSSLTGTRLLKCQICVCGSECAERLRCQAVNHGWWSNLPSWCFRTKWCSAKIRYSWTRSTVTWRCQCGLEDNTDTYCERAGQRERRQVALSLTHHWWESRSSWAPEQWGRESWQSSAVAPKHSIKSSGKTIVGAKYIGQILYRNQEVDITWAFIS